MTASGFKHLRGILHLVVTLPDASIGTIAADVTDVFGDHGPDMNTTVLSIEGLRHLRLLAESRRENRP